MKKIVKIIYDDGTHDEIVNIPKLDIEGVEEIMEIYKRKRAYERQFKDFEETILENINQNVVENYAEWNLGLINEDEIEKTNIDDFSDKDILEELAARKILVGNTNIINQDFLLRFSKIIDKENNILLENILNDFEKKLKL